MKRTCKANTFAAMNSMFLNTQTMRINEEWLNELVQAMLANKQELYPILINKRIKPTSAVWQGLEALANDRLQSELMNTRATSAHLKAWLDEYGANYGILQPSVDWVIQYREDYDK